MPLKLMVAGMAAVMLAAPRRETQEAPPVVAASGDQVELNLSPINPDWIIEGAPVARVGQHSTSADEASSTAVWDCTAGEFRWFFSWDETVVIQEGEVHVTGADGASRTLRAGDIAYFRGGTWATWRVDSYVRKIAFLRKPFPEPLAILYRMRNALRSGKYWAL
ncbi:cupin domain-containing protein [Rhizobium sp. 18065]|uniref:cupin domain-containing protein n=1 Tax=Rhizobium sp. 18065 TaxID=2681411 RepID=UPI00135BD8A7|nr:cupin domain-containing protein [Rhizobium sp. 18065]